MAVLAAAAFMCAAIAVASVWLDEIQFELGYAFEYGSFHGWTYGFPQNHRRAAYWLHKAADSGHPRAQYMLGILYAHGWGVARNGGQATKWFTRAANGSYGPALYHLGWMYHKGDDVPRDYGRSMQLLERAARQGMASAHLALGSFYERGEGVTTDRIQALKWYSLAVHYVRTGPDSFDNSRFAAKALAARDRLSNGMSHKQVADAQTLAREWLSARRIGQPAHMLE
jgi:TPR repeat protein